MLWIKKFRTKKLQSIMIFLIIMMCTFLLAGSSIILTSLNKPYNDLIKETHAADMKVFPLINATFSGKDWIGELESFDCIEKVYEVNRHFMNKLVLFNNKEIEIFMSLTEYTKGVHSNVRLLEGTMDGLDQKECYIPSILANTENIKIGDTISFYYEDGRAEYIVKAIFADAYSLNTAFQVEVLINHLPEEFENDPYYATFLTDEATGDDVIKEYTKVHDGVLDGNFNSVWDSIGNASLTEKILGGILLGISVVIFLVILVMIRYMMRNMLLQDKKTIAIYKSIGYSDKEIKGIYITFYLVIAFAGTLVGVMASPLITSAFMKSAFNNLGVSQGMTGIVQSAICMITINLIVFFQLSWEIGKLKKLKPVEILTDSEDKLGVKKTRAKYYGKLTFTPFSMAFRMLQRDKKNTFLIIITCMLCVYIVNMSVVCIANIDGMKTSNYYWLGFDKHDVTATAQGNLESFYKICDDLASDSDVERVVKRNFDCGFAIPYQNSVSAMIYESYEGLDVPVISGRNPIYNNEIVIGNIYKKEMNIEIGDYLTIYLDEDIKVNLLIVGTYQGFYNLGRNVKVRGGLLEENGIEINYPECSIILKDGVDKEVFLLRVSETYGDTAKFIAREDLYANVMDKICDPQKAALGPFALLALLIGAININYIIYSKNIMNKKKYTIYKSLGYTASHLVKMNCYYVGMLAIASIALAIPIFIFAFPNIMVFAMSAFGFAEYKNTFRPIVMVIANILVFIIFIISAMISSRSLYENHVTKLMNE